MRELTALVGRRGWLPLPENPTPILDPTGLGVRPFGPKFSSPRYKKKSWLRPCTPPNLTPLSVGSLGELRGQIFAPRNPSPPLGSVVQSTSENLLCLCRFCVSPLCLFTMLSLLASLQWLKIGGSAPLLPFEPPCNSMSPPD